MRLPRFYTFGGHGVASSYVFGYVTGAENDDCCVIDNIPYELSRESDMLMLRSPSTSTRLLSLFGFVVKRILLKTDYNWTRRIRKT